MYFILSKHCLQHFYILHRCDFNFRTTRKNRHSSLVTFLSKLFKSRIDLFLHSTHRLTDSFLDLWHSCSLNLDPFIFGIFTFLLILSNCFFFGLLLALSLVHQLLSFLLLLFFFSFFSIFCLLLSFILNR